MQARISAVQQALFGLLIVAVLLGVVTRPAPQNQRYKAALDEIDTFRATFDRAQLEHSLIEYAAAQGRQPLSSIQRAAAGKQVPALQLAPNAGVLEPLTTVSLATLADVQAFANEKSTLSIAMADAPSIGRALSWRLVSDAAAAPFTLQSASIAPAAVTQADLDLEPEVARLQLERSTADAAVQDASKKLDSAEQVFETRRKWKLPWKALVKSDEARKEAKATLIEKQKALKDLEQRYAQASARAQAPHAAAAATAMPEFGVAQLAIQTREKAWPVAIPVKIAHRDVVVPSLRGGEFTAIHASGLWPEVRGLDPAEASAAIRKHFNWHYSYVEPLGFKIGGMTLLQILPCVLPFLLALVLMRMRAVSSSYNPFGTKVKGSLPRVGFMNRLFDAVIVVLLPVGASVGAAVALMMVGQVPALPVINAIVCLLLGGYAFMKLGELQTLIEEVVRSHSNPPPDSDP
jgi:hypothetical protein